MNENGAEVKLKFNFKNIIIIIMNTHGRRKGGSVKYLGTYLSPSYKLYGHIDVINIHLALVSC